MYRLAILLLLACPLAAPAPTATQAKPIPSGWSMAGTKIFAPEAKDPAYRVSSFVAGPNTVIDPKDGSIHLSDSRLLADEMGATDYKQAESLSDKVLAKKIFVLDSVDLTGAELFMFYGPEKVKVNGTDLGKPDRLVSTGWSRLKIPSQYLKKGDNEFVFSGGGSLIVEPGRGPGHSYKSTDGGKTWSKSGMTGKADQQGEYLVRFRLGQHPLHGSAVWQLLDLSQNNGKEPQKLADALDAGLTKVPYLTKYKQFELVDADYLQKPPGTKIVPFLRTGPTPAIDDKTWTDWMPLDKPYKPDDKTQTNRWAQLKFELSTTDPNATPRVPPNIGLSYTADLIDQNKAEYKIVENTQPLDSLRSSVPFLYDKANNRLKLLRERYKLDEVIAPGKTETEKLMLLRYWVRHQWHTAWQGHPAEWMPPWDTLIILESKDQPDCLTMCTHYGCVFTQCCQALGWNARHCILDHHCVAEVYINEHQKWVMMDAGNSAQRADVNLHFEKNGVPMSARELHVAYTTNQLDGITVRFTPHELAKKIAHLCRPDTKAKPLTTPRPDVIPLAELKNYPVCQINNYRRYAFPGRNNFLSTLYPGELYQGWSEYFYDGYWWVGDSPNNPKVSPEYSFHLDPNRPQEADWKLNWTRIYLSRTDDPKKLQVHLATETPNFKTFEKAGTKEAAKGQACASSFVWDLQPGTNTLTVWTVNQWDRQGTPARIVLEWNGK